MNTTTTKQDRTKSALHSQGVSLYACKSSYPEHDAPRNLAGRTHYVDPDTLKGFGARILNAGDAAGGLLYWLVESVKSRPDAGAYTRRAVIFDVFGEVVNERDTWHKDTKKAVAEALEFVCTFDAVKHTGDKLVARAKRDIETAKKTLATLRGR
jgi:hypothetical protein